VITFSFDEVGTIFSEAGVVLGVSDGTITAQNEPYVSIAIVTKSGHDVIFAGHHVIFAILSINIQAAPMSYANLTDPHTVCASTNRRLKAWHQGGGLCISSGEGSKHSNSS